jgi:hypothetical protein
MLLLKIVLIALLLFIFLQDYKTREVYWFLYPAMGMALFFIQVLLVGIKIALINSFVNFVFVTFLLVVIFFYSKYKFKKSMLQEVFGLGDVLFFYFICFSFAVITFFYFFIFSLIFSLVLHMVLKNKQSYTTVPLAGYMSLFFGFVYAYSFIGDTNFLFAY